MPAPPLDCWLALRLGTPSAPSPGALAAWQFQRLRAVLAHAGEHGPFYSRRLAGVRPESVRTPEDLGRLPRTSPGDLRARPEDFLCVSQDEVARPVTLRSSGSSGPPKRLFFTAGDMERTTEFFRYGMRNMTEPGDAVLVMLPGRRPGGVGRLLAEALERSGRRGVIPPEDAGPGRILDLAVESGTRAVVGAPAHVNALASIWAERGLPGDRIRSVLLCWDAAPEIVCSSLRRILGCRVFRHWGMTETGLGGAVECAEGSGLHLREADLYVEITDPATGRPLPDGQHGEIVVTTLSRRAMPLIRYRTGDRGRLLPGACACGSPARRLDRPAGRFGEDVLLPTGDRLRLPDLAEAVLAVPGVMDFTADIIQESTPRLRLRVQTTGAAPADVRREVRSAAAGTRPLLRALNTQSLLLDVVSVPNTDAPLSFEKRTIRILHPEAAHS